MHQTGGTKRQVLSGIGTREASRLGRHARRRHLAPDQAIGDVVALDDGEAVTALEGGIVARPVVPDAVSDPLTRLAIPFDGFRPLAPELVPGIVATQETIGVRRVRAGPDRIDIAGGVVEVSAFLQLRRLVVAGG